MSDVNEKRLSKIEADISNNVEIQSEDVEFYMGYGNFKFVDEIQGEATRWYFLMETIICVNDRFYSVKWEQGLTEMQENYYKSQTFVPVRKHEYEKMITVVKWVPESETEVCDECEHEIGRASCRERV